MNLAGAVAALLVTLATVGALPRALRSQQPSPAATPAPRAARAARTIAIDERLAADAGLRVGDRVVLSATPAG